ncbi:hypothetical protein, partial [Salmonella sp. s58998]|uniref:hypothetical protein n=1 Tax=Salmonella sp. s58998 TaxID=3159712 RepID=UPI00397EFF47
LFYCNFSIHVFVCGNLFLLMVMENFNPIHFVFNSLSDFCKNSKKNYDNKVNVKTFSKFAKVANLKVNNPLIFV